MNFFVEIPLQFKWEDSLTSAAVEVAQFVYVTVFLEGHLAVKFFVTHYTVQFFMVDSKVIVQGFSSTKVVTTEITLKVPVSLFIA